MEGAGVRLPPLTLTETAEEMAASAFGRPRRRSSSESTGSVGSANSIPASPSLSPRADRLKVRRQRRTSRVKKRQDMLCMCPQAVMSQIHEEFGEELDFAPGIVSEGSLEELRD